LTTDARNLILVRHAETQWNREGRFQGHLDSQVTDEGIAQIQAVARRLQTANVDAVYTSDLGRSILTADRIARAVHAPVFVDARLRERNHGLFEGLTHEFARSRYPELLKQLSHSADDAFAVPFGESRRQLLERALEAIQEAAESRGSGDIVVIGHGALLRVFLNHVLGYPLGSHNSFRILNCSMSRVVYERGRWRVETIGDADHLQVLA
jgi:broad specificity phosphatase PhoE